MEKPPAKPIISINSSPPLNQETLVNPAELESKQTELESKPTELGSNPIELASNQTELPSSPIGLPSSPIGLPSSPIEKRETDPMLPNLIVKKVIVDEATSKRLQDFCLKSLYDIKSCEDGEHQMKIYGLVKKKKYLEDLRYYIKNSLETELVGALQHIFVFFKTQLNLIEKEIKNMEDTIAMEVSIDYDALGRCLEANIKIIEGEIRDLKDQLDLRQGNQKEDELKCAILHKKMIRSINLIRYKLHYPRLMKIAQVLKANNQLKTEITNLKENLNKLKTIFHKILGIEGKVLKKRTKLEEYKSFGNIRIDFRNTCCEFLQLSKQIVIKISELLYEVYYLFRIREKFEKYCDYQYLRIPIQDSRAEIENVLQRKKQEWARRCDLYDNAVNNYNHEIDYIQQQRQIAQLNQRVTTVENSIININSRLNNLERMTSRIAKSFNTLTEELKYPPVYNSFGYRHVVSYDNLKVETGDFDHYLKFLVKQGKGLEDQIRTNRALSQIAPPPRPSRLDQLLYEVKLAENQRNLHYQSLKETENILYMCEVYDAKVTALQNHEEQDLIDKNYLMSQTLILKQLYETNYNFWMENILLAYEKIKANADVGINTFSKHINFDNGCCVYFKRDLKKITTNLTKKKLQKLMAQKIRKRLNKPNSCIVCTSKRLELLTYKDIHSVLASTKILRCAKSSTRIEKINYYEKYDNKKQKYVNKKEMKIIIFDLIDMSLISIIKDFSKLFVNDIKEHVLFNQQIGFVRSTAIDKLMFQKMKQPIFNFI